MPAGDLITIDYQVEVRALLLGAATKYQIDPAGIKGLGVPPTKTADTQYEGRHGSSSAPDFLDTRVLTFPFKLLGDDPEDAGELLLALNDAWAPADDGVDVELHLQLPGFAHRYVIGRPRGAEDNLGQIKNSVVEVLCRFDATDPELYVPAP